MTQNTYTVTDDHLDVTTIVKGDTAEVVNGDLFIWASGDRNQIAGIFHKWTRVAVERGACCCTRARSA